jgi:uncharacterized membrane protein
MTKLIITYLATLITFLAIDMVWLTWIARATYVAEMGDLIRKQPNITAAVIFYLLYAAGLMFFAIMPGLKAGSVMQAMVLGAAVGLLAYGTYDLTNLSVLNGFSVRIALIDLAWGTVLSGVTTTIVATLMRKAFAG